VSSLKEPVEKFFQPNLKESLKVLSFVGGKTPSVREGMKARRCVSTLKLNNWECKLQSQR